MRKLEQADIEAYKRLKRKRAKGTADGSAEKYFQWLQKHLKVRNDATRAF